MVVVVASVGGLSSLSATRKRRPSDVKTMFPTVIIPYGKDGLNNHAFVVVDYLIFGSTQTHAMKLCRESLDWICGENGMASINIALRFNQSFGTKERLQHKEKTNW
jgi:hypothetical protein